MDTVEKVLEMRGMHRSEIINYFISIGGENIDSHRFKGQNWEVEVSDESYVALGSLKISMIIVIFRCKKELLDDMIYAFRLKFLTAGG